MRIIKNVTVLDKERYIWHLELMNITKFAESETPNLAREKCYNIYEQIKEALAWT